MRMSSLLARSGNVALAFLVATSAIAQDRAFFRWEAYRISAASPPPATPLSPPPAVVTAEPADFGAGTMGRFTVNALVGEPFSLPLATINGTDPISWTEVPSLPPGISFLSGVINGTPAAVDARTGRFAAVDAESRTASAEVRFDIRAPEVSLWTRRPFYRVGNVLDGLVRSNVRTPTYTLALPPGAFRRSIGLDSSMELSGQLTSPGTYDIGVTVTRPGTSILAQAPGSLVVAPPLTVSFDPPSAPSVVGPMSTTIRTGGVYGTPTLSVSGLQQLASRGLTYQQGVISGTLTAGAAITLVASLVDSADGGVPPIQASLLIPQIGQSPSGTASIGVGPGRQGNPLPAEIVTTIPNPSCVVVEAIPGVDVSASCVVTGTPTVPGQQTLVVDVTPADQPSVPPVRASATVVVAPPLSVPACSPGPFTENEPLSVTCAPNGIVGTPTFELDPTGATPAQLVEVGLVFDPATGTVSGTPLPGTSLPVKVVVRDSHDGATATVAFQIVTGPPTLTHDAASYRLRGGRSADFGYQTNIPNAEVTLVGAPSYVTVDAQSRRISIAAPQEIASLEDIPSFTIEARSSLNPYVFVQAGVVNLGKLVPALLLDVPATAAARGNVEFASTFTYSGAVMPSPPFNRGALPPGLVLGEGTIAGKPTAPGSYPFEIVYRDSYDGEEIVKPITISVGPLLDLDVTAPLTAQGALAIVVGSTKQVTIEARNALGTVTIENVPIPGRPLTLASLGLGLPAQGGTLDWTPTQAGAGIANIRMTEVHGGITTVIEKPLQVSVTVPQTAAAAFPVGATGAGGAYDAEAAVGALYDVGTAGTSVTLAAGQSILIAFEEPVTANGVLIQNVTGITSVTAEDSGTVVAANVSGTGGSAASNGFTATTSRVWRIAAVGAGVTIGRYQIAYGAAAPTAPSFLTAASYTGQVGVSQTRSVSSSSAGSATGTVEWENVGDIPPGMGLNPSNGQISGTPTTPGTFVARLRMRVGGVSSAVKNVTFTISP